MIILDAHQDIAFTQLAYGRDYRQSALLHRRREKAQKQGTPAATIGLPDSLAGRVALVFATLYVSPAGNPLKLPDAMPTYSSAQEAHTQAMQQLDIYQRLADNDERVQLVRTQAELDAVLATWEHGRDIRERKQGLVILMEGADPIIEPKQFEAWYERGVRIVGPAWSQTRYAGGTGAPGGLTRLGHELLEQMLGFNALLDLSHLAEQAYNEALDQYNGPLIASHSNPRKFRNSDRHLSDDMIRRLAERDGVMGIVLYNRFLSNEWQPNDPQLPFSIVLDAIDHVCQITGSAAHVGIGSDFDGGFGAESIPATLNTTTDLLNIADGLRERGYSESDVEAVMSGNMLRKLRESLPI
jgi:membrane dipeptidase